MIVAVLIDCDIHVGYEQITDLLPYLDGPTRELVRNSGTNGLTMPSYPWNHPTGWFRHDLYERGTGGADFAYLTLDTLRGRHLDVYDISMAVLEPDEETRHDRRRRGDKIVHDDECLARCEAKRAKHRCPSYGT